MIDVKVYDRKHSGPREVICATCGQLIAAYESRRFGDSGAVHVWKPGAVSEPGECLTRDNKHKYPYFYTDG